MALIEHSLFGTTDKVQTAIDRLRAFEPKDRPYWLAFSGGKDSCVILELAKMSGVNFEAHYNVTSVDPPELVRFVKKVHPEQYIRCFNKMAQNRKERGLLTMVRWETGEDIYDWWVGDEKKDDRQLSLLAEDEL